MGVQHLMSALYWDGATVLLSSCEDEAVNLDSGLNYYPTAPLMTNSEDRPGDSPIRVAPSECVGPRTVRTGPVA